MHELESSASNNLCRLAEIAAHFIRHIEFSLVRSVLTIVGVDNRGVELQDELAAELTAGRLLRLLRAASHGNVDWKVRRPLGVGTGAAFRSADGSSIADALRDPRRRRSRC